MNATDWAEEKGRVGRLVTALEAVGMKHRAQRVEACLRRVRALEEGVRRLREALRNGGYCGPGDDPQRDAEAKKAVLYATAGLVED